MASIQQMNNALPETAANLRKNRFMANPFVCEYQPSVCSRNPINEPFIGKIIPIRRLKLIMRRIHGFTLIELVVTMAVAAILVAIAVPNMRTFIQNGRLITQTNDLIGDLNFARSEAIKRRTNIGICRSADGVTFAAAGPWRDGRVIFVDANRNNACDAGETILRFRGTLASATDTLTTNAVPYPVIFSANGGSNVAAGAFFTFCDDRGPSKGKQINLNSVGQATVNAIIPGAC